MWYQLRYKCKYEVQTNEAKFDRVEQNKIYSYRNDINYFAFFV